MTYEEAYVTVISKAASQKPGEHAYLVQHTKVPDVWESDRLTYLARQYWVVSESEYSRHREIYKDWGVLEVWSVRQEIAMLAIIKHNYERLSKYYKKNKISPPEDFLYRRGNWERVREVLPNYPGLRQYVYGKQ